MSSVQQLHQECSHNPEEEQVNIFIIDNSSILDTIFYFWDKVLPGLL